MSTERLQIQFLGLNEGDDPKNLPPGTLLRALNHRMDKGRRLRKRWATTGLAKTALSGSNIAAGKRLLPIGTGLAVTDGETAWSYVESLAKWHPIDRIPCWRVTKQTLADSTRSVSAADIAISGDLRVTAYSTPAGGVYVKVDSVSSGLAILVPQKIVSASCGSPRVLISGTTALVLFSGVGSLTYALLNLTTMVVAAPGNLVTNSTTALSVFDAVIGTPTAGVATLYVAYELASGTNRTRLASFTFSTLAAIATLDSLGTGLRCACVAFVSTVQQIALSYSSTTSTSTKITTCTTALGSQVGPTQIYAGASDYVFVADPVDALNVIVGWTRNDGNGTDADRLTTALYSTGAHAQVATSERITFGLYNPSKPWLTAGRWYVAATTWVHAYSVTAADAIAQSSTVVVEVETVDSLTGVQDATHPHVATLENQTGWYAPSVGYQTKPAVDSAGTVWLASPYRNREPQSYIGVIPVGWSLFRLAVSEADTFRPTSLGAASLIAGGAPVWLDGGSAMPLGFAHPPQIISVTPAAGGAIAAGIHSYVATYAWRDSSNGLLHRSAPSPPKTGMTGGSDFTLLVKVATSSLSAKQRTLTAAVSANPVYIELWRTNGIAGTGDHYLRTLHPSHGVFPNDPRAGDVTFTDALIDSNITSTTPAEALSSQQQLYTDLGELENIPPPSLITVMTHRGRLAGIGPDSRTIWLSKDSTLDTTLAPGFNEALTLAFAHDKSALASMDTVLVVFGEDSIDVVHGDGPDDKGEQNTWQIQAVQTDHGCIEPRSIISCQLGCVFLSSLGLALLDRGLNVTWFGGAVDDTLTLYPNITSAVLVAAESEVRFTCDDGSAGIVLAYDYTYKVWFTRKYTDASDTAAASIRFVDAKLIDGVYTLLTAGGQVYRESTGYLDGGTAYVETDALLAPISAQPGARGWSNDNLAWQRAKDLTLMGTSTAQHDLKVSFAKDYSTTFSQTHTFAAGSEVCTPGPLEKGRVTIATQKCQAIQIRIQDLTPTGYTPDATSAGPILEALCLRVGAKSGPSKTTAGQQA